MEDVRLMKSFAIESSDRVLLRLDGMLFLEINQGLLDKED